MGCTETWPIYSMEAQVGFGYWKAFKGLYCNWLFFMFSVRKKRNLAELFLMWLLCFFFLIWTHSVDIQYEKRFCTYQVCKNSNSSAMNKVHEKLGDTEFRPTAQNWTLNWFPILAPQDIPKRATKTAQTGHSFFGGRWRLDTVFVWWCW